MREIYLPNHFLRQFKRYHKKFRNLENDLIEILENFDSSTATALGHKLYKIRLKSGDLPKGKNKSFRLIIFLLNIKSLIIPLTIYFKSDKQDITEKEIEYHLEMVLTEIQKKKML